jgi:hypothetical protein
MRRLHAALLLAVALVVVGACDRSPTRPSPVSGSTALTDVGASKPTSANGPRSSEQVVFSGIAGIGTTFPNGSPVGFWIWCEAESSNPYEHECNGSLYFYALGLTKHVEGEIEETGEDLYKMTVSSTLDHTIVDCVLENTAEAEHGPHNEVRVSCTTPSGSAVSNTAVVNVTGPGD